MPTGVAVFGQVLSTNGGTGTYSVDISPIGAMSALNAKAQPAGGLGAIQYQGASNAFAGAVVTGVVAGHGTSAPSAAALTDFPTQATNTVVANVTSGTAAPTATAVGSCSTASSALQWTTNTGFGCNTAITAAATPLTTGTSVSLAAPRGYFVCTSTCTITLPVPAAGYEFCVRNDNNVATVITFNNPGSSVQFEKTTFTSYGTATTGTAVSGGAAGDKLCIVGRDSTHYLIGSYNGTWTMSRLQPIWEEKRQEAA